MNKELCFCIESVNLYLEQVLVEYMNIPIFFLCKGDNEFYIVLCNDIDEMNYLVTKISLTDTYNLLHGKIPMRSIILKQKEYWTVSSGEEIDQDKVSKSLIDELDVSFLPEDKACFKILTREIELFVQKFDDVIFNTDSFCNKQKEVEVEDEYELEML